MRMVIFALAIGLLSVTQVRCETTTQVIENAALSVRISTEGAELQSIMAKDTGREYLWQGDPSFWSDRAPIMFPVNVRFKGDRYTYQAKSYVIPKMGLAIYRHFEAIPTPQKDEAAFELIANKDTLRQYPFPFRLRVTYRLDENRLINEFRVENQGTHVMPFALGGHPGFVFPLRDKDRREDFEYHFSQPITTKRNEIADSLIQPTVVGFLSGESRLSFGDDRIPDGGMLMVDSPGRVIGLAKKGGAPFVTVDLGDFPNVNLWSPPGFPFACIEPMIAHHDFQESDEAIDNKDHLIRLSPGESKTYRYTITVYPES